MNNIINRFIIIVLSVFCFTAILSGEEGAVVLDAPFFKAFNSSQIIERDEIIAGITNKIVIGRGKITGISVNERYKKSYRIIIESADSVLFNQKIIFYVFLENKDTVDLLTTDSKFEFKGQLMGFTPLGTKRNEYILDIILMDGSTVIE
jgi:hypothetical protein